MARIEVPMPQMGESIAEGTVSRWLKELGDTVERDEPILEISTDKVDAEIPAPSAGTLVSVEVQEGETVEVGTIVAYIDTDGGAPDGGGGDSADEESSAEGDGGTEESGASDDAPAEDHAPSGSGDGQDQTPDADAAAESGGDETAEDRIRTRSTPVVRKIAAEHGVEIGDVPGSGHAGRVTKQDILDYIESGEADRASDSGDGQESTKESTPPSAPSRAPTRRPEPSAAQAPSDLWQRFYSEVQHPEFPVRDADRVEAMDKIRRLTAEHMVIAKRVAPHVHSFVEVDFTAIDAVRKAMKPKWEEQGVRVSYTSFVVWAVSRVLRDFPMVNSTVSGNNVIYRGNVNVGIAVDLDPGLIVPVIHDTDDLSLAGIGRKIVDLAGRARNRKLQPAEIQGATFSVTNPGVLGTTVGMPVIPKGTAAILGTGSIDKRVVVVTDPETGNDAIAIRKRCFFSLGYDHRIVDGADAARFLASLKDVLEDFPVDA